MGVQTLLIAQLGGTNENARVFLNVQIGKIPNDQESCRSFPYLACGLNGFAQRATRWFAQKDVTNEFILSRVHYKCTIFDVFSDAQEAQIAHTTFGNQPIVILYY